MRKISGADLRLVAWGDEQLSADGPDRQRANPLSPNGAKTFASALRQAGSPWILAETITSKKIAGNQSHEGLASNWINHSKLRQRRRRR
jgi:hypothetical protein